MCLPRIFFCLMLVSETRKENRKSAILPRGLLEQDSRQVNDKTPDNHSQSINGASLSILGN